MPPQRQRASGGDDRGAGFDGVDCLPIVFTTMLAASFLTRPSLGAQSLDREFGILNLTPCMCMCKWYTEYRRSAGGKTNKWQPVYFEKEAIDQAISGFLANFETSSVTEWAWQRSRWRPNIEGVAETSSGPDGLPYSVCRCLPCTCITRQLHRRLHFRVGRRAIGS